MAIGADPLAPGARGARGPRGADQISYDVSGVGEPLLLLHGVGSRRQIWQPVIAALATSHRVYALDLPGFGESPDGGRPVTVERLAADVVDFCASRLISAPHLVGNSMGGGIALLLGARGLAASVTAFSPIGFWHEPGRLWCVGALTAERAAGRVLRPQIPRLLANPVCRVALTGLGYGRPSKADDAALLGDVDALLDCTGMGDALASFASVRFGPELATSPGLAGIPVTVAWGRRDILLTAVTQPRRARTLLPAAVHEALPGCGHVPFSDDPQLCAETILRTIARA